MTAAAVRHPTAEGDAPEPEGRRTRGHWIALGAIVLPAVLSRAVLLRAFEHLSLWRVEVLGG